MSSRRGLHIVYTCFGGTHSSPVAAAIHLGALPRDTIPTTSQLMSTPFFDQVDRSARGRIMFAGTDARGHRVYVLGRGRQAVHVVQNSIVSAWALVGTPAVPLVMCDTLPCVNTWMRIGGWLSREANQIWIGRPIVIYGTKLAYKRLVQLVEQVEKQIDRLTQRSYE